MEVLATERPNCADENCMFHTHVMQTPIVIEVFEPLQHIACC